MTYFILWGPSATLLQCQRYGHFSTGRDAMTFHSSADAYEYIKHSDRFEENERSMLSVLKLISDNKSNKPIQPTAKGGG